MPDIILNGNRFAFYLKRSARAVRLRLEYSQNSQVKIVAPYYFSNHQILHFLFSQKAWIHKQFSKQLKTTKPLTPFSPILPLLDLVDMNADLERTIQQFKIEVAASFEKYSQILAKKPKAVYLKKQRRRWGSCGIHENIYINWMLIFAPVDVLNYVVLHECCHLFYRNHGRRFWALVKKTMPDYKIQENWLRHHASIIDQYQHRLSFSTLKLF